MVKRRLTDLIQEEAQKVTIPGDDNVIEVTATSVPATTEAEVKAEAKSPVAEPAPIVNPINKELEAQIKQLQDSLEKSQKTELDLRQEISDLEAKLLQQKQAADKFKKELGEAKKAAVHLADANSKLSDEIDIFKQEKAALEAEKLKLESEKIEAEKVKQEQPKQSQIQKHNQQEISKSLAYRKSHRALDNLPNFAPPEEPDDSMQMWLLD